jgi:hypothetical protein
MTNIVENVPRLLARFTQPPPPRPTQTPHPDDELDAHLRRRPKEQPVEVSAEQAKRMQLRGIPAIAQDAGQPNDERRNPYLEVLARQRRRRPQ